MRQLWLFFSKYNAVFLFLLLMAIGFTILFTKNKYQEAKFYKSTATVQAGIAQQKQDVLGFFQLKSINQALLNENQQLLDQLQNQSSTKAGINELNIDSLSNAKYSFVNANVITNELNGSYNYITIDKGMSDGIEVGNGVITANGVVGKIVQVSQNYALVMSLFNRNMRLNIHHKASNYNGDLIWQGNNIHYIQALNISRIADVNVGDTISTNQYSKSIPENTAVGTVEKINSDIAGNFYILDIKPNTDFRKLNYVYIVQNKDLQEINELENRE